MTLSPALSTLRTPSAPALRCPDCGTRPVLTPTRTQPLPGGTFGLLCCGCATYPLIDDIPVLRRGRIDSQDHLTGRSEVEGPTADELVALLRADRPLDALVALLAFPPPAPLSRPGLRLPFTRGPWPRVALAARRAEVRAMLGGLDRLTAQDWMELAYARSSDRIDDELLPYFLARFGQPRFLATTSLLRCLPDDGRSGPVLDLACGFGHVAHHLATREDPRPVVGVDRNFLQLWVARRYVAPTQTFVCADRVDALPFADDAFAAAVCSDAFHYFDAQQGCLDELRRVAIDDTVLLDRLGNVRLAPTDGPVERDPAGYVALLHGAPWRLTCEDELLEGYRAGYGPQLASPRHPSELDGAKWLMLVTSRDERVLADHGAFTALPHAAGVPTLNPVFDVTRHDDDVELAFTFPSTWYAFENAAMLRYTSAGERLNATTFAAVAAGHPTDRTPELLRRCVLLGMPERYRRAPGIAGTTVVRGLLRGLRRR
ncbi:class I SAM-dependent methyltransferase [Actinomycetospora termitidis]|uniref:Class I SAM-dependent methyltransferase n=1 Tax=Actinomycetospora termitidis TaxID=3053470 RepID=A0ABT7MGT3_9PSEU|nr:class I SAM-dependent methyltransferase [Actinomycetospora sp. Odt1-22]MDL5159894.1 class I SAM-dependent methyltransferase [Actinomycetospora sp. Odt1-22]